MRGKGLGRKIGFPTANIFSPGHVLPSSGVYAAITKVGKREYLSAVNIGRKPTLGQFKKVAVEAHLLNFKGNLKGKHISVVFLDKIRDEKKFLSLQNLQSAIASDIHFIKTKYSFRWPSYHFNLGKWTEAGRSK